MQAVKRDCNAPFTHNLNAWLRGRQSIDLNPFDLNRTDRQTDMAKSTRSTLLI